MAQIIQIRRDTAAQWTSVNPILSDGEWGFETDTKKLKVGDGVTAWISLAYMQYNALANVKTITASYIVLDTDEILFCDSATDIVLTLPDPGTSQKSYFIDNGNEGRVSFTRAINGDSDFSLYKDESVCIYPNGSSWRI